MNLTDVIKKIIDGNDVLVQIGANDGRQDDEARESITSLSIQAHLVEPVPLYFDQLVDSYKDYPLVKCYNLAIAEENGEKEITYVHPSDEPFAKWQEEPRLEWIKGLGTLNESRNAFSGMGGHLLKNDISNGWEYENVIQKYKRKVKIKTKTLESFLSDSGIEKVDIFITDTEGHDGVIFGQLNFDRHRPKLISMETHTLGETGVHLIEKRLADNGYEILQSALRNSSFDTIAVVKGNGEW